MYLRTILCEEARRSKGGANARLVGILNALASKCYYFGASTLSHFHAEALVHTNHVAQAVPPFGSGPYLVILHLRLGRYHHLSGHWRRSHLRRADQAGLLTHRQDIILPIPQRHDFGSRPLSRCRRRTCRNYCSSMSALRSIADRVRFDTTVLW
jgi:hypothetical protein